MNYQISLNSTEQSTPISLFQQLSDTASENLSGGSDSTCATCFDFVVPESPGDGVVNIRFMGK
ncbi:MAG: hypothetical protein F6J95_020015 [Leptolyngbya sp. SIO1E4]|nr:hypothetical protein [Leptolyngbya sp. SIO1E4]